MKKMIAAITAVCIALSGCGVIAENKEIGRYVPTSLLDTTKFESPGRVEKLAIYFYNASSKTLTAEIRTIPVGLDKNPAEAAVKELLRGPYNDKLAGVAPEGMTLDSIEYSRDVANVYLSYDGEIGQPQEYILEYAISNTVTNILGTTYTCIFYNGIQTGFTGKPYNPIKKQTGNIEEAFYQASSRYDKIPSVPTGIDTAGEAPLTTAPTGQEVIPAEPVETEISTVLYFISKDGGYILPEVREVKYTDGNYVKAVISELVIGPLNSSTMETPLADDLVLENEPVFTQDENGDYILTLNFSKPPTRHDVSDTEESTLSYAALTYTLTSLIPGLDSINILVNGNGVIPKENSEDSGAFKRSDYSGLMGSSVPLYFADKNSDLLLQVSRSMEQGRTWSAKERLFELMKGPLSGDNESAWPVMPAGVNESDIISVNVYADTVFINLSKKFKEACKGLSSKNEMLLIYAIVNTLTAMDGINKVQFLVEGKQTDTLAGFLCPSDPFLRNYGIIKQAS